MFWIKKKIRKIGKPYKLKFYSIKVGYKGLLSMDMFS